MIDLRSDTLTQPTQRTIDAINEAKLGDDGRLSTYGKGEDPTVNKLEKMAAEITGKEDALFCNSGTMANIVALLSYCKRGDAIGIDPFSHIYQSEEAIFMEEYFGRQAILYDSDDMGKPIAESLTAVLLNRSVKLLCLENTFGNKGGTCLSVEDTNELCQKADEHDIPVHLDGARIFNAAAHLKVDVKKLVEQANTVQFCLSKGLGAPVGSVLCGTKNFISKARKVRKLIGGGMRQAGVIAAAGIEALKELESLQKDNENALLLSRLILHNTNFNLNMKAVQTNIVMIDVSPSGLTAEYVQKKLMKNGLLVKATSENLLRFTIYRDIEKEDIYQAASLINEFFR